MPTDETNGITEETTTDQLPPLTELDVLCYIGESLDQVLEQLCVLNTNVEQLLTPQQKGAQE